MIKLVVIKRNRFIPRKLVFSQNITQFINEKTLVAIPTYEDFVAYPDQPLRRFQDPQSDGFEVHLGFKNQQIAFLVVDHHVD